MAAGLLAGLVVKGISLAKTFVTNAQVGKQVLASGAQVTTTTAAPGQLTSISGPGTAGGVPIYVWAIGGVFALLLFVVLIFKRK